MKSYLLIAAIAIVLASLMAYFVLPGTAYQLAKALKFGVLWGCVAFVAVIVLIKIVGVAARSGSP